MPKFILAILFPFCVLLSFGQTKPDKEKEKINSECDKFMHLFQISHFTEAFDLLKHISAIGDSTLDGLLETVTDQMNNVFPSYGKIMNYEFIGERNIKNIITKRFYLLKFQKYFLKFDFTIYNSESGWTVTNFTYDDNLIEVLY